MNLYLVRHGEASPVSGTMRRDADRTLTSRGEEDVSLFGDVLARVDGGITVILTSPLVRAAQTARIIASRLPGQPAVKTTANLSPGFRAQSFLAELAAIDTAAGVVAVGHQPDLGEFLSILLTEDQSAAFELPPGAAVRISYHSSNSVHDATLHWLLTPEILHKIRHAF